MTPERWRTVGELFHAALDKPEETRKQWVEDVCAGDAELRAEVLSLLGSDAVAGDGFITKKVQPAVATLLQSNGRPGVPEHVGPYRLVRELGRGGMGTVYLAERDDDEYRAQVAIKLVRRGMDTDLILSRFYRERQTLARLQHPNIARLLDGGTTGDGCPYIVMEFVEGDRITMWCQTHNLSVTRRLTLFLDVCKAVSYAHRQLVVHRDLKPGNILVDDTGEVKLLDFGICKLLQTELPDSEQTAEIGLVALTPDYASPEQIRGDPITVASDIYSLGAVLYEMLTGVKPHRIDDYSLRGMERAICETEVLRASVACTDKSVSRLLRGDLDNILSVALDKDPRRRYQSADHFAEDIRRHLDYEPVRARPDSLRYRLSKFVRRRQGLVAATAAVLIILLAGMFASLRSARIANDNLRLVRQLANTFLFDVHDSVKNLPGATRARQLIVQTGLRYLEKLSASAGNDADFLHETASAYRRVGDVQGDVMNANLGSTKDALASYEKALALLDSALKNDPGHYLAMSELITLHRRIGNLQGYRREQDQALSSFQKAQSIAETYLARNPEDFRVALQLSEVHIAYSNALRRNSEWAEAKKGYSKAIEILEKLDRTHPGVWETRMSLASAYSAGGICDARQQRFPEALAAYRRAVAIREDLLKSDPANIPTQRDLMFSYSHLGDVLGNPNLPNTGDTAGAVKAYSRVVEIARRIYDADPADKRAQSDFAIALSRMAVVSTPRDVGSRIRMLQQAIDLQNQLSRTNPDDLSNRADSAVNHLFLGDAYLSEGDAQRAAETWREGIRLAEPMLSSATPTIARGTLMMYRRLGELTAARGDRKAALLLGEKAMQLVAPENPLAKRWTEDTRNALCGLGTSAAGYIHVALWKSAYRQRSDAEAARLSLRKAGVCYRALEGRPTFTRNMQQELRSVESELEGLK